MANIDLKLSSKEDKITHRSEILIRFYQGQKIDFRVKTGLFIQPRHFKYFVNRAATKKQGVNIPDKITSVCKDEAKAKGYVVATRGEVVITDRLITPDVLYDKEQARLLVDLQTIIMDAFVKVDKENIPDDWLDKIVRNSTTGETEMKRICDVASSHMARRTLVGAAYKAVRDPNIVGKMSGHVEGSRAFNRYRQIDDDILKQTISEI